MSYYQNSYSAGDTFTDFQGNKYIVVTGGNTPSTPFDSSNIVNDLIVWGDLELEPVQEGGQGLVDYAPNTSYNVGDTVIYDDKIYRCIVAHTSTSTFDGTKWEELSPSDKGLSIWESNTVYNVDDIVIDSNLIWQCVVSHTSTTTFDESKWVCISGGEISNGMELVPLWGGEAGDLNSNGSTTIELSESISSYQKIGLTIKTKPGSDITMYYREFDVENYIKLIDGLLSVNTLGFYEGYGSYTDYIEITSDSTNNQLSIAYGKSVIIGIIGIRKAKPIVSSGMKYETLWEGEAGDISSSGNSTINLSDNVNKYQKIGIEYIVGSGGEPRYNYKEFSVSEYMSYITDDTPNGYITFSQYGSANDYVDILNTSGANNIEFNYKNAKLTKVVGISEGVVVPTGLQAARVTLWEGFNNTLNSVQTLSDNIKNYDQFEVTYANNGTGEFQTRLFNVSDINNFSGTFHCDGFASWGNPPYYFVLTFDFVSETTWKLDSVQGNGWNFGITKITGIKYIQPDSYSTEEKLIGTWIDGKPLYKKTLIIEDISLPSSYTTVDTTFINSITGLKDIVNAFIIAKALDYGNGIASSTFFLINDDKSIAVRQAWGSSTLRFTIYFTIEYTKN